MNEQEVRELIRDLAGALLDTVSELQAAEDVLDENGYSAEMVVYDRAVAWLARNPARQS
jgi:hypothetical protein